MNLYLTLFPFLFVAWLVPNWFVWREGGWQRASRRWLTLSVAPTATILIAMIRLAFEMHHTLGRWPTSIGTDGFPEPLQRQATLVFDSFWLVTFFGWFVTLILSTGFCLSPRTRFLVPYFGTAQASILLLAIALLCFPEGFRYWLLD